VLVGLVTLPVVQPPNTQDVSRLCLSRALVHGRLSVDRCITTGESEDRSAYGGHLYTSKAPGLSVLEIVPSEVVRLPPPGPGRWDAKGDLRLWFVRLVVTGVPFLLCVWLVGRISEGLAPGFGGLALVVFALGTEMDGLGTTGFDHVLVAALGLTSFFLLSRRRTLAAGLAAGAAVFSEYEAAAVLLVLLLYAALQGVRPVARFVAGALPGLLLLGAYDWGAFGAPWHPSYWYLTGSLENAQRSGVLGVALPTLHGIGQVFLGDRGLLLAAPVLLAAAYGLVLVGHNGFPAEALVCGAITVIFLIAESGYFDPYGGRSPGPRFFAAALPFLALGLGPAFGRRPVVTTVLAVPSLIASAALTLSWQGIAHYRDTVWGEIARTVTQGGSARLMQWLPRDALTWGANRLAGVTVIALLTLAVCLVALRSSAIGAAVKARRAHG
jgi:hypothetical protein